MQDVRGFSSTYVRVLGVVNWGTAVVGGVFLGICAVAGAAGPLIVRLAWMTLAVVAVLSGGMATRRVLRGGVTVEPAQVRVSDLFRTVVVPRGQVVDVAVGSGLVLVLRLASGTDLSVNSLRYLTKRRAESAVEDLRVALGLPTVF